jgi:hypothetical protein
MPRSRRRYNSKGCASDCCSAEVLKNLTNAGKMSEKNELDGLKLIVGECAANPGAKRISESSI